VSRRPPIVTWTGGARRQLTAALDHCDYAAFDAIASRHNLAKGTLARILLAALVRDPALCDALVARKP